MNKTKRCQHCTGAMVTHWSGPQICINCGREGTHRNQGPTTCNNCIVPPVMTLKEMLNDSM